MEDVEIKQLIDDAYKNGHNAGYKECEKSAMAFVAALTLKQGGESRISDLDMLKAPEWIVERYRDEQEACTVLKVWERKD